MLHFYNNVLPLESHTYNILTPFAAPLLLNFTPSLIKLTSTLTSFWHLGSDNLSFFLAPHTRRLTVLSQQPLHPQPVLLSLESKNSWSTLDCLSIWIIVVRITPYQQFTLHHFLLYHFTSQIPTQIQNFWTNCLLAVNPFYPTPSCSPILTSFYPLWINYPLTLTAFWPHRLPNSCIILPPLNILIPHS